MKGDDLYFRRPGWLIGLAYGYARGDERKAEAVIAALESVAGEGSIRTAAKRCGVAVSTLARWVAEVKRIAGTLPEGVTRDGGEGFEGW